MGELSEVSGLVGELKESLNVARAEASQHQRDSGVFRTDLNAITKENQTLNQHVVQLTTQLESVNSEKTKMCASLAKESSENSLRTMERDDVLTLYKETVQ